MTRYARSNEWLARARKVTPNGSQTRSKAITSFVEGAGPACLQYGDGARVWDLDGNEYVDMIAGLGAIGLGYNQPSINRVAKNQIDDGVSFSLPHMWEMDTAELILQHVAPWAEQVRFVKSGSEATEAATRIARVSTGRDIVISIGYHGWHSVHDAAKDHHPGVPGEYTAVIDDAPYNDLSFVERLFEMAAVRRKLIAAVLVEPTLIVPPKLNYLQALRNLCSESGALLIFDEMITGFRWALGGGSEYFGVTPDLACYGKAIANGFPLSCVVGPEKYMRHAIYASSTFGGDAVSLAAASATIEEYVRRDTIKTMWRLGTEFVDRCSVLFDEIPMATDGYPVHPRFKATTSDPVQNNLIMSVFVQECAANGLLVHHAGCNIIAAMTPQDMGQAVMAVKAATETLRGCRGDWKSALKGLPIRPAFQRVNA